MMLNELNERGTEVFHKIIWINEGSFKLLGNVNGHYCTYWCTENNKSGN